MDQDRPDRKTPPLEDSRQTAGGKKKRMTRRSTAVLIALAVVVGLWTWWGNSRIGVSHFTLQSGRLPGAFSGFRIAQVSDLHNKDWGSVLPDLLKQAAPDAIFITGDLIDRNRTDVKTALEFTEAAVKIAPVYFVTGNHEMWSGEYEALKEGLSGQGVRILENQTAELVKDGQLIRIAGVMDPAFSYRESDEGAAQDLEQALGGSPDRSAFTILLAHRPEYFALYADAKMDLVFSGHAHGGQFRLPVIGALFAPGQGFLPPYTSGISRLDGSAMLVSRGLGNSTIPIRFNNPPELVILDLTR